MDIYESLREMLDTHPSGCPPAQEITEILGILFTEDEAKTALGLGFMPFGLDTISQRAGVTPEFAGARLEALADKGLVYAREKDGKMRYALMPVMPGLFEFPFMKGKRDETLDRLAALWKKYMAELAKGFGSPSTAFSRIIPVGKTIENLSGVLTYEKIDEMIDNAKSVGLAHCACRESEQNCDAPREACMLFDETCDFLVERGFARFITKEEMKRLLIVFDNKGLVHQVNNAVDKITFICNCCDCCCGLLRSQTVYGNHYTMNASGFLAECDSSLCNQCGICVDERCPVEAMTMGEDGPEITAAKCLGCGLCVTGCPLGAMKLTRREGAKTPAKSTKEMGMRVLMEKGKLNQFLPYITPDARPNK